MSKMDANDEFGPLEAADELSVLKARVTQLESREMVLLTQQSEIENEFGQKRSKFRELFLQKEEDLKTQASKTEELETNYKEIESRLADSQSELNDIKTAVAVSESDKEEEISKIRQQCSQEIETMQALLRDAAEEASSSTAAQYETERVKLHALNENYEEEIQNYRSKLSKERHVDKHVDKKGFLTTVADIVGRGTRSEAENLEESMRKAQMDAEILKNVVMPLEQEIDALKHKLNEYALKIRQMEKDKIQLQEKLVSGPVADGLTSPTKTTSLPSLDGVNDPEEKIEKLTQYLKVEKAARIDLEFYVSVMSTQKKTVEDEMDKIRDEMKEVCTLLDEEKRGHSQLKQTWNNANDQFLESQRLMMMDMRRMEGVLSAEQQRQIAEQQQKDHEREVQERKVQELAARRHQHELDHAHREGARKVDETTKKLKRKEAKLHSKILRGFSASNTSINSTESADSVSVDDSVLSNLTKSHSNLEISSMSEQDFIDNVDHDTRSLNEMDNMTIRISPEKVINLPSLTEAQVKAITDPTPDFEAQRTLMDRAKSRTDDVSLEGKRVVSDTEWNLVQEELKQAHEKLGRPCDMCNNYETQLQSVQDEFRSERTKTRSLDRELASEKKTIDSQKNYITELENSLKEAAESADTEVSSLINKLQECEKYISELRQQHNSSQVEMQYDLKRMIETREEVQKELVRLQEENDSLVGKHSKHAQQLQNEDINLPNTMEDMQLLLLKYREDIISAKVSQEHNDESLRSQMIFLKDQLVSEQQERSTVEETLTQEINSLQERLAIHDSLKSELERESSVRSESESKLRETEQALKSQYAKSKQLIHGLQRQLEEQSNARTQLENEAQNMRSKVMSLQTDLANSEAVQRDFVKLSQSLQIQLEKLRQSETEVRWSVEDDVDDCHNCKLAFSVTKRKHHCRHCGKIFCSECITKTVNSGPKMRPAKVCDVCHTILVKDATPFFSTEPPTTPD